MTTFSTGEQQPLLAAREPAGCTVRYTMRQTRQNSIQSFAFVISVCLAVCLGWSFAPKSGLSGHVPGLSEIGFENRINPNTAPLESLMRLPGLGVTRAGAIVAYRENVSRKRDSRQDASQPSQVFRDLQDIEKVDGIGPKTAQNISEWLKFE